MADLSAYKNAGVDYNVLDKVKREAIELAHSTSALMSVVGGREFSESRGASAYVFEIGAQRFALVTEGLGTKSVLADQFLRQSGTSRFRDIAIDAVAAIVNDVISVGAVPVIVTAYFATGDAAWYSDERRSVELLKGWHWACEEAGAVWGGGESPALPGVVSSEAIELAGSSLGIIPAGREPVLGEDIQAGDVIVILESSGLHANGASLARSVVADLPDGLLTRLPGGALLGDALLTPSIIYARFVRGLLERSVRPRMLNAVTGHGFMKVMRARRDFHYVIDSVPPVPEVLQFLVDRSGMSVQEAYGTLNMGAGYVAVVRAEDAAETVRIASALGYRAAVSGYVEEGARAVSLPGLGVEFADDDLQLH